MMETEKITCCFVALLFSLTSVSAVKKLNSVRDLKKIPFGQSVPAHSLVLLHWFANTVLIEHNNEIRLTFNPRNGDYGSHYFHNHEGLLDSPPRGQQYYIVGNVDQSTSVQLPSHVQNPPALLEGGNRDRIIIRVRGQRIDRVYLTQHSRSHNTPWYDPHHTYQITTNLLRQVGEFPMRGNQQTALRLRNRFGNNADVSDIRDTWGDLVCLGLFLCIVMERQIYRQKQSRGPEHRNRNVSTGNSLSGNEGTFVFVIFFLVFLVTFLCYQGSRFFRV